jgi:very-short-patch-repair endonuclease
MTKDEYVSKHGPVLSSSAQATFNRTGHDNFDWINRAKQAGDNLSEYRVKMGKAVSDVIMNDLEERSRRSKLMGELNKSPEGRERSSVTAKRTSARPEIITVRTENLRAWREREPEKFQAIITKMIGYRTTKPEKATLAFLQGEFPEHDFKGNRQLRSNQYFIMNKSRIRQIDIMSRSRMFIVEVDGHIHFHNISQWDQLALVQAKDVELNDALPRMGYTLVRISSDQWNAHTGEISDACKHRLIDLVRAFGEPTVHFIGEQYDRSTLGCERP